MRKCDARQYSDLQVDRALDAFENSPFLYRRRAAKDGYEVIEMTNVDWREVITDDQKIRWTGKSYDTAKQVCDRLAFRFALAEMEKP